MTMDPRETLAKSPMSRLQVAAVAITVGLNALDGFDVLSISFASPGIAREWGIDRAALGFVLMMELLGMGLGSVLLGGVADRMGRRRMILGCLAVMTLGMFLASKATGVYEALGLARVHRCRYRRHAGRDQRRGGGILQCKAARSLGVSDGDRLSHRCGDRRLVRGVAAQARRLAGRIPIRRGGDGPVYSHRISVRAGIHFLVMPAPTPSGARQDQSWSGSEWVMRPSLCYRRFPRRRARVL